MPVAVGFGIGTPEQAAEVGAVADGVIVGSRLVRAVAEAEDAGAGRARRQPSSSQRHAPRCRGEPLDFRAVRLLVFTVVGLIR